MMKIRKPKTLDDLPKVAITSAWPGDLTSSGCRAFDLKGTYDPTLNIHFEQIIEGKGPRWFWLLFDKRGCLHPELKSFDRESGTAILTSYHQKEMPRVLGFTLAYLSPYWQAYNVWMVLDPTWGWQKKKFPQGLGSQECQLCYQDIDTGESGYCDPKGAWMCGKCYERYVVPRDLSFIDEL